MSPKNIIIAVLGCLLFRTTVLVQSYDGLSFLQLKKGSISDESSSEASSSEGENDYESIATMGGGSNDSNQTKTRQTTKTIRTTYTSSGSGGKSKGAYVRASGGKSKGAYGGHKLRTRLTQDDMRRLHKHSGKGSISEESSSEESSSGHRRHRRQTRHKSSGEGIGNRPTMGLTQDELRRLHQHSGKGSLSEESSSEGSSSGGGSNDSNDKYGGSILHQLYSRQYKKNGINAGPATLSSTVRGGTSVQVNGDSEICRMRQITAENFVVESTMEAASEAIKNLDENSIKKLIGTKGFKKMAEVLKRVRVTAKQFRDRLEDIHKQAEKAKDLDAARKQATDDIEKLLFDEKIIDLAKTDCKISDDVADGIDTLIDFVKSMKGTPQDRLHFHQKHTNLNKPATVNEMIRADKEVRQHEEELNEVKADKRRLEKEMKMLQERIAEIQSEIEIIEEEREERDEEVDDAQKIFCEVERNYFQKILPEVVCASRVKVNERLEMNNEDCVDALELADQHEKVLLNALTKMFEVHKARGNSIKEPTLEFQLQVTEFKSNMQVAIEGLHKQMQIVRRKCDLPKESQEHMDTVAQLMLSVSIEFDMGYSKYLYYFCMVWTLLTPECKADHISSIGLQEAFGEVPHEFQKRRKNIPLHKDTTNDKQKLEEVTKREAGNAKRKFRRRNRRPAADAAAPQSGGLLGAKGNVKAKARRARKRAKRARS